jgi:hypothetical protein
VYVGHCVFSSILIENIAEQLRGCPERYCLKGIETRYVTQLTHESLEITELGMHTVLVLVLSLRLFQKEENDMLSQLYIEWQNRFKQVFLL